jgi:hypothetical protein
MTYLAYMHSNESPEVYHKWVALSVLSGAVRRKVFFSMEGAGFLLYPNLYVVLVSPPGRCKKSTAMRNGRLLLAEIPGIRLSNESVTRERLIQDLSQSFRDGHSSMTAYSTELASLMSSSKMDMVAFLTDIYDNQPEWSHASKTGGMQTIKGPYLNLLGAATPDWISRAMPLDTVGIGLTSRIIFVYEDTPRIRPAFPKMTPDQRALRESLLEDLIGISNLAGEYMLAKDAEDFYEEWYRERSQNVNPSGDDRLSGYYERKPMHMIKVAMLIAASFRDELIIMQDDVQQAMILLQEVEDKMPSAFAGIGKNPLSLDYGIIIKAIAAEPGISFADLMDRFKHNVRKQELSEILDTVISSNKVRVALGSKYYPTPKSDKDGDDGE